MNLFMDFEIQSVSDLFSILFKMEEQADLEIATLKDLADLSEDALFLHFQNGYINHILGNYHASVESIQDMDAQYREKALSEIQNRLLDDNSSIHSWLNCQSCTMVQLIKIRFRNQRWPGSNY